MPPKRSESSAFDLRELPRLAREFVARRLYGREHYIAFRDHPIVYGRVPKAANTTIKFMLARLLEEKRRGVSPDEFWKYETGGQTYMLRTPEAAQLGADRLVFTFVRDPLARLASFFDNKVRDADAYLPQTARKMGLSKADSFARVVDIVCDTPSAAMDIHVLPQAEILVHKGVLIPSFVGRYETFAEDWDRLRQEILTRGAGDPGEFRPRKRPSRTPNRNLDDYFSEKRLIDAVQKRYAEDFRLFYPDMA
jgi:hypothetical protein